MHKSGEINFKEIIVKHDGKTPVTTVIIDVGESQGLKTDVQKSFAGQRRLASVEPDGSFSIALDGKGFSKTTVPPCIIPANAATVIM